MLGASGSVPSMRATTLARPGPASNRSMSTPVPSTTVRRRSALRISSPDSAVAWLTQRFRMSCCVSSTTDCSMTPTLK
jgi:hypothetical protein